ncbi:MAG: UvrD-helicase domain-containing protein [bacterium]|nr:UvrD-helicase domain-containing protein [bacterium]
MSGLPDLEARRVAATDFATNLVVLAGAGTGKTSLLVERALNAIGLGHVPIASLAAITFTEKAAGEMRERLATGLDRLRALAAGEGGDAQGTEADRAFEFLTGPGELGHDLIAQRALAAMQELDRAQVVTIHGFCSQLLREHPIEAGVDPEFGVDSGEQAEVLRDRVWEEFLAEELGPGAERADAWSDLLRDVDLETIKDVARSLSEFDVPLDLLAPPFESPGFGELLGPRCTDLTARIEGLLGRLDDATQLTVEFFEGMLDLFRRASTEGLDGLRAALDARPDVRKRVLKKNLPKKTKKLDPAIGEEMERLAGDAGPLARQLYETDDDRIRSLLEIAAPFVSRFRETFLRSGLLSFDGLLVLTRDLLRDHVDVRRRVRRRYRMLLIDEFQDTDPLQYEIVLFLAERDEDGAPRAFETRLAPGRLFVVGDAKQSVYRFRGADYPAYRCAVDRIVEQGGRELHLVGNFRSVHGVLRPVNELFGSQGGGWGESDYQPTYVPIEAVRRQDDGAPRVEIWSVDLDDDARAEERREAEGLVLAERIRDMVEEQRICSYRQITILFRAFPQVSIYLRALRERGIPFVVDGGRDFLKRPEVTQLIATLRALSHPIDAPALLAFLRSPAGGVADDELARYAAGRGRWDWRSTAVPDDCPGIRRSFELMQALSRETRHLPADSVIQRVVARTHMPTLGAAAFEGAQRVANLQKLAAAAGELARDGRLSLAEVVDGLRTGQLIDIKTDSPLADDAAEAVRITSIHRMKGLENDWIFVPDVARGKHRGGTERSIVVGVLPGGRRGLAVDAAGVRNVMRVWFDDEGKRHAVAEEARVLYVALTRARERLCVLLGPSRQDSAWVESLRAWGYDAETPPADDASLLDGAVRHRLLQPERERRRVEREAKGATESVERYARAIEKLHEAARPPFRSPSTHDAPGATPSRTRSRSAGVDGAAVGDLLHRWLESWDGKDGVESKRLEQLARTIADTREVEAEPLLAESRELVGSFLQSGLAARWREVEIVGREIPLLLRDPDGTTVRGQLDLLYREPGGDLVVADFKTDRTTNADELSDRYRSQLETYASAVQHAMSLLFPPRMELWVLRSGERVPVANP